MKHLILCPLLFIVALSTNSSISAGDNRPNVIVVMADDMGFSDLGCYGSEIKTPTIDQLASDGVRFSQFYNCALCGPSRASLMTGCYPWNVGQVKGNSIFANLTKNCATVIELLKANGYRTCAVGRLDMVTGEDWHDSAQIARCADRFLGSASGGPGNYFQQAKGSPWFENGKPYDRPTGAYSTDLISTFVADFIKQSAANEQPFFIYVSHYAPHWPLQASEEDIAPYRELYQRTPRTALMHDRLKRLQEIGLIPQGTTLHDSMLNATDESRTPVSERLAIHGAMIESIDRSLTETMVALQEADKLENTLILVLSDNGASHQMVYNRHVPKGARPGSSETFINHGSAVASLSNTPFRNYKVSNYEGGIASPLIAWWPRGLKQRGRISHVPCHIADIMPTCLELANATYPSKFQGRNLTPLAGQSFVSVLRDRDADQQTPRVMVWPRAVRKGNWKLVIEHGNNLELYNILQDRNEKKNLAAEFPEQVRKMKQIHEKTYAPRLGNRTSRRQFSARNSRLIGDELMGIDKTCRMIH